MRIRTTLAGLAAAAFLAAAAPAYACSISDTQYFDGFLDQSCLVTPLAPEVDLDTLGGLRLHTNGNPVAQTWNTDADFGASVDLKTLFTQGAGDAATLELPASALALVRDTADEGVLGPTPSANPDNEHVDDPSVVKVGANFVMYYTGLAEDGRAPAIFKATSTDANHWTKVTTPVLTGTNGAFDQDGVSGAKVIYTEGATPAYRMWYSGQDQVFGRIGYATSDDGTTWTKYDDSDPDTDPDFVVDHGRGGSRDSFVASDPTVLKDGETWKMWYEGDDSTQKSILFATSSDGITWNKGGAVLEPKPGSSIAFGAFAPTVWKDGSGYHMLLGARDVSLVTQLDASASADGITWSDPSPALNPAGTVQYFDSANLNSPDLFIATSGSQRFKLFYSGQTQNDVGIAHSRIGISERSSATGWNGDTDKGPATGGSVLDVSAAGIAFDSRESSGPAVQRAGASGPFVGFYTGRKSDLIPRLGMATWDGARVADTADWTKSPGNQTGGSLLPLGAGGTFDSSGQSDPSAFYSHVAGNTDDWHLWFTAHNGSTLSIGYASADDGGGADTAPTANSWTKDTTAHLVADGTTFDATGVSDPSVVNDGTNFLMFYTGHNGANATEIGRATSATVNGTFTPGATSVVAPGAAGEFDHDGVKDPVVIADTNMVTTVQWHMLYTGVEKRSDGTSVERTGYATSDDANAGTWTKHGLALNPSQQPFSVDEVGVRPQGAFIDGTTFHVWYDGVDGQTRTRGNHASVPFATLSGSLENGWATYQFGDVGSGERDWRTLVPTFSGQEVQIWVSFLQPYSTGGSKFWSDFFPLPTTTDTEAALQFLLTVEGVRWQARLADPDGTGDPSLDEVVINHAPVSFFASGQADTAEIKPPAAQTLKNWQSAVVSWSLFQPLGGGTGGGTVTVLDGSSGNPIPGVATASLTSPGDVTIDLSGVSVSDHPTLKLRFALTSGGTATPLIKSLKVNYLTNASIPVLTLTAAPTTITAGQTVTLSGTVTRAGTPVGGASVTLLQQQNGGSFTQTSTATTNNSGAYSATVSPSVTTTYRASYQGQASPDQTVTVNPAPPPPPPPAVTIAANPAEVIFGQPITLSGNLAQSGAPLASQSVQLLAGAAPFGAAVTDGAGNYTSTTTPQANTAYAAAFGGTTSTLASVGVHQKVTLKATRKGGSVNFKGSIAPAHPNRDVVIQLKKGSSFVTFAKANTGSTSAFTAKKKLKPCGKFQFRAVTAADADHMDGTSAVVLVEKHRVKLTVKVKGKTVTFTGSVAPSHKSGTIVISKLIGKKASKIGKTKLTKRSTFKLAKKLKKGKYVFVASAPADKCHFAGVSAKKKATVR